LRIRLNSIMAVAAFIAIVSLDLSLIAQGGQGQGGGAAGAQAAPGAQGGQRGGGGARGGGGGGGGRGGARGAANQTPAGPAPRLANGKPDLSGHWNNPYTANMAQGMNVLDPATMMPLDFPHKGEALPDAKGARKTYDLPYTDWGLAEWKAYDPEKNGDYAGSCLPFGISRSINSPHGVQVLHTTDAVAFLFEQNTWFHFVPIAREVFDPVAATWKAETIFKWPGDLPPSWNGVSVGHWEGDKLVMETTGFNGYTRLDTNGHPHSKELKMTNTFERLDARQIRHTVTVHDPKAYTHDWMNLRTWNLKQPNDVIMEYSCEENNLGLDDGTIAKWHYPDRQ
jgi:hypothetical protein